MVAMIDFLKTKAHQMQNTTIQDSKYAKTLALSFLLLTGARPNEAAFVLFNNKKSVIENDDSQWVASYPYKAKMGY